MYELRIDIPKAKVMDGLPELRDVTVEIEGKQTANPHDNSGDADDLRWTGSFKGTMAWDIAAGLPNFPGDAEVQVTVEAGFSYQSGNFECCNDAFPLVVMGSFKVADRKNNPTLVITGAFPDDDGVDD